MIDKINVASKFDLFGEYWSPKIIGELNETFVKAVKLKGEFVWHSHQVEDEMFYVFRGRLRILLRDRELNLEAGEFVVIPHGVEHLPIADDEAFVLLFEPRSTVNTGTSRTDRTVDVLERI